MFRFASKFCINGRNNLFIEGEKLSISKCISKKNLNMYNQKRYLSLHEYQSLELMKKYGVKVPKTCVSYNNEDIEKCIKNFCVEGSDYVLKAQVLAGGRGLGYFKNSKLKGGIHICSSIEELKKISKKMLGDRLITKQTGIEGRPCNAILISERFYIRSEKYIAILIDRICGGMVIIGSAKGGSSIEDIAEKYPESIFQMSIDIDKSISRDTCYEFAQKLGFREEKKIEEVIRCIEGLCKLFVEKDCTLIEVNPFAETHDGSIIVCDAKINFDDNAEYRQKEIYSKRDIDQEDKREIEAQKYGLNYVGLDGDIGCMVNGAGLAMATMDIIKLYGGEPSNFLDVGGGASKSQVVEALRILQNDNRVRVVFTNIFGGIMRCDTIALGIIHASQEVGLTKPLIVRLQGTKQEAAKEILDNSGLRMIFCNDFEDAAQKAVKMTQILNLAQTAELDVSFAM